MMHWIAVVSTAYCLWGTMADGTQTRAGSVAENVHALGTRVEVDRSPTGGRSFVIRDRIGWGTQLDFWVPTCSQALAWGRRVVHLRLARQAPRQIPMEARVGRLIEHYGAALWAQAHGHELP